jgi:lambda family phage minor tail protein L
MSDSPKIIAEVQKLEPDALIELFILDLTELGGSTFYFHNQNVTGAGTLGYGGMTFEAIPIEAKGWAFNGTEQHASPTIRVSTVSGLLNSLVKEFDDLTEAKLTRIRTFRKHLDDGTDPDGTARFSHDVFIVDRKSSQDRISLEFELASSLDVYGTKLPGRRALSRCQFRFKDGDNCPYVGAGTSCAKTVAACRTYFGSAAVLPYGGFPGLERYRMLS